MLLFGSQLRSYRDLPFRYAEASTLHRDELERVDNPLKIDGKLPKPDVRAPSLDDSTSW